MSVTHKPLKATQAQLAAARNRFPGHGLLIIHTGLGEVQSIEFYVDKQGRLRTGDAGDLVFPIRCEDGLKPGEDPFDISPQVCTHPKPESVLRRGEETESQYVQRLLRSANFATLAQAAHQRLSDSQCNDKNGRVLSLLLERLLELSLGSGEDIDPASISHDPMRAGRDEEGPR
jgi:hypothetical protein